MFYAAYLSSSYFGFSQEDFLTIYYIHVYIRKINDPPWVGPVLTLGLLFEQTW
jgi:hypothetical protein